MKKKTLFTGMRLAVFFVLLAAIVFIFTSYYGNNNPSKAQNGEYVSFIERLISPPGWYEGDRQSPEALRRASGVEGAEMAGIPQGNGNQNNGQSGNTTVGAPAWFSGPREEQLVKAGSFNGDLSSLPYTPTYNTDTPERPEYEAPQTWGLGGEATGEANAQDPNPDVPTVPLAPAPAPLMNFEGLDFNTWGQGHPPDTNGDVGPTYYIQAINTSIGIYDKSTGAQVAAFTFNTFMSQGSFGNLCDTNNYGDPVVLYDTFEDRWVITDFAFVVSGGNVVAPAYECFAVSKTGDPVSGGWNYYSLALTDALNDYPKLGVWTDGIYMSANMFTFGAGSSFIGSRVWALNKAQMYAGTPTVQVVSFNVPGGDFTVIPSNARLQTGTPPAGTPNYFVSTWQYLNAITVYKFHVDWNSISLSTFTGPDTPLASTSWPNAVVPNAPSLGGNNLDVLQIRAMMQNQYTNIGGAESLWITHTVRRGDTSGFAAPRWYQANVTGGSVAANLLQATTWDPDAANVMYRFMPSLAVDRSGNMALGYSTSSSTTKPAIKYAGRLSTDPINTFSQTEQVLYQGLGTQVGNCGTSACQRWGDYSSMTLDPDGCTFWYTTEYYDVDGLNHQTRIGSFQFPGCTVFGSGGTVQGTVTRASDSTPIVGATIQFGARTATTDGSGFYQFTNVPAGTYLSITASYPGYVTLSASNISVVDGETTTNDFALTAAATSQCYIDTTQADFLTGLFTNCDLTGAPGDVTLVNTPVLDQQNTAGTNTGTNFATTSWGGQTFIPAMTGALVKVNVQLFSNLTGTPPDLTLSVRATNSGLPTGPDLASTTIPGFSNGASTWYTATFSSPVTLTSGTQYALVLRPVSAPAGSGYFWIRSSPGTYANGQRVISTDNGSTWTSDSTRDFNFKTYIQAGYAASGTFISSVKDANPANDYAAAWNTISWTASTDANTNVKFQAAASNNPNGPFGFVGPDGTAATYFTTSGASLSQFDGLRYLKYEAYLTSTDNTMTPVLNDVTICYINTLLEPAVNLSAASLDFGSQLVGTTGGAQSVTITNTGLANLHIDTLSISGDYAFSANTCDSADIAMNGSCSFSVTFSPTAAGSRTGTVTIPNNAPGNPHSVSLSGNGISPEMDVQGNSVTIADGDTTPDLADHTDFGSADVTSGSVERVFTIENIGTVDLTLGGTPKVAVSGANAADFTVTVDPSSPVAASGSTTFTVHFDPSVLGARIATISIANDDADETPYNFDIQGMGADITAPIVTVPANMTVEATGPAGAIATFSASATDETDPANPPVTCLPASGSLFPLGATTVTCSATDTAGNTGSNSFTITVEDTTAPDTTIIAKPANPSNSANTSFSFTSPDVTAKFECSLDGAAFAVCTSPAAYPGLADGSHSFDVRAIDPSGNTDATPATFSWVVDTVAPLTTLAALTITSSSPVSSFSFTGEDGSGVGLAGFECQLDGGGFAACTSPKSYTTLLPGSHTIDVRAIDAAGNVDATPSSYTWTVIDPVFKDVPNDFFKKYIDSIYSFNITSGCSVGKFCPYTATTRAQMAVMILRAVNGKDYNPPDVATVSFSDVPATHWAHDWIEEFYKEGFTSGCGGGKYCPESAVNRAQAAAFVVKAMYGVDYIPPAPPVPPTFSDTPDDFFLPYIEKMVADGITAGCGGGKYCPNKGVLRTQMAVFLVRAFDLPVAP